MTNEEIDAEILRLVRAGFATASPIIARISELSPAEPSPMRTVDKALQRLRRNGAIKFDRATRQWRPVSNATPRMLGRK